ncbi:hypothetical protein DW66_5813 [Pseudomonas putida]|uniref:Uncharacterized protein n=4 Tax=Pseudomonas putida group TaxID=136845 RepID=A0AAQ1SRA4_9PSED|nr:hypothetical protein PputGB1_0052 [Pseudomonas putida GB-1]AHZ80308.1 hypothetical protein DW66_5813 [Pseudomonas putida]AJG16635.1 hypothetical protein RK21_05127 [Pseudomonas plecoglossicida]QNL85470.1 Uncharacterized protein PPKH_0056 [Pseudomonas putida]SPO58394.1 conserved protein of unknown function [Pseudomonas inefficax]
MRKPEALNVLPAFLFLEVIKHGAPSSYLLSLTDDRSCQSSANLM